MRHIWHKQAFKMVSNPQFLRNVQNFEKDILREETFLEVFEYLNREELDLDKLTSVNSGLATFIRWARLIVSYHILVHPYKLRNTQTVKTESDVECFLNTIDSFMGQFYQLKAFLMRTQVLPRDTNFAFNLSHVKFVKKERKCLIHAVPQIAMDLLLCNLNSLEAMKLS